MDLWDIWQDFRFKEYQNLKTEQELEEFGMIVSRFERQSEEMGRMMLVLQGIWEICQQKLNMTEKDLIAKIKEIDLRDGNLDGQFDGPFSSVKCTSCSKEFARYHSRCIFCNERNGSTDIESNK